MIKVRIIRVSGDEEERVIADDEIASSIGASVCDVVNLRNGKYMYIDDEGYAMSKLPNPKATALYHSVCVPGTTHQIVGDVVVIDVRDEEDAV